MKQKLILSLTLLLSIVFLNGCTQEQAQKDALFRQGIKTLYAPVSETYNRMIDENLTAGKIDDNTARIEKATDQQVKDFINKAEIK